MEEKVFFDDINDNKVCGILSSMGIDTPIVIMCHGFTTNKNSKKLLRLQKELNNKHISTLRIDLFAHGESEGNFEDITLTNAINSAFGAINFCKEKGFRKIGLIGSSFGGATCILTSSKSKDLFVLGLISPVCDYYERDQEKYKDELKDWKNKGFKIHKNSKGQEFRLNYSFIEDQENNRGYQACENIDIPTIIIHGDADKSVSVEQSIKISKIIKDCKLEIIKDCGHHYSDEKHFDKMIRLVVDFIQSNI